MAMFNNLIWLLCVSFILSEVRGRTLVRKDVMKKRCGVTGDAISHHGRSRRSIVVDGHWNKTTLTYAVLNGAKPIDPEQGIKHARLTKERAEELVDQAFAEWAPHCGLRFERWDGVGSRADIMLSFERGSHGDEDAFDGPGRKLAHADYPNESGVDVHFDDDETWVDAETNSAEEDENVDSFYPIALHEIGHGLGLKHSDDEDSIMYAYENSHVQHLSWSDIQQIRQLYEDVINKEESTTTRELPTTTTEQPTTTTEQPTTTTEQPTTTTEQPTTTTELPTFTERSWRLDDDVPFSISSLNNFQLSWRQYSALERNHPNLLRQILLIQRYYKNISETSTTTEIPTSTTTTTTEIPTSTTTTTTEIPTSTTTTTTEIPTSSTTIKNLSAAPYKPRTYWNDDSSDYFEFLRENFASEVTTNSLITRDIFSTPRPMQMYPVIPQQAYTSLWKPYVYPEVPSWPQQRYPLLPEQRYRMRI